MTGGLFAHLRHNDDPRTSHDAIAAHDASGLRATNLKRVQAMVESSPGRTAGELEAVAGLPDYEVRRRLSDLKKLARVAQGSRRICTVTGNGMMTWWPAEPTP